jgi:anaphase-promoting complex subunit 8
MKTIRRIRESVKECSSRHLNVSAKWLSELLVSIDLNKFENQRGDESSQSSSLSQSSSDLLLLVESYMSLGEYARVVYTIEKSKDFNGVPKKQRCQRLYFLRSYAKYLLGEKRKEQKLLEVTDPLEKSNAKNDQLQNLRVEMSELKNSIGLDAFNMYLLGIVYKASGVLDKARDVFVEALNAYPFIWSAWVDLALLCKDRDALDNLKLRDHWMVDFFRTHALLELQQNEDAWQLCSSLKSRFGESSHLATQMALVNYNMRRFDDAQDLFERLSEEDPHRLDAMDTYSNILYVLSSPQSHTINKQTQQLSLQVRQGKSCGAEQSGTSCSTR